MYRCTIEDCILTRNKVGCLFYLPEHITDCKCCERSNLTILENLKEEN